MSVQSTINRLLEWSEEWQMLFNSDKCHILHLGNNNARQSYSMGGDELKPVEYEKDFGVVVHQSLKPHMQYTRAAARATELCWVSSPGQSPTGTEIRS